MLLARADAASKNYWPAHRDDFHEIEMVWSTDPGGFVALVAPSGAVQVLLDQIP